MRLRSALLACAVQVAVAIPAPALAGCADIYLAMSLGPFPADAAGSSPLFYGAESAGGSFSVRFSGLVCSDDQDTGINAQYADTPGSAQEGADYVIPDGQRTPTVCQSRCQREAAVAVPLTNDPDAEPVVESFSVALSNPSIGSLDPPTSVPFLIVDDDGVADRVALDDLAYEESESHPRLAVPVWRAGPATGTVQVPYRLGGGGSTATADADYRVTSPNPLVFAPGDRVELVVLFVENDELAEGDETLELSLETPTGAQAATPASKVLHIRDNEEFSPPRSRLHHPRQGRTYRTDDYRLREIHVFTEDTGGSGVLRAQLAIRSNLGRGRCGWYSGRGFRSGSCDEPRWIPMAVYEPDFFFARLDPLRPTRGTAVRSYTAFSRAFDGAGNAERDLTRGRNSNTFEVRPARGSG